MRIYLLCCYDYELMDIEGIYSSKEKALEAAAYFRCRENDIKEFEVDRANVGEKYERFYYYNIRGGKEWGDCSLKKPSEVNSMEFIERSLEDIPQYQGWGRTPEEAENNAKKCKIEHP